MSRTRTAIIVTLKWMGNDHEASTLHEELQMLKEFWGGRHRLPQGRAYHRLSRAKWLTLRTGTYKQVLQTE